MYNIIFIKSNKFFFSLVTTIILVKFEPSFCGLRMKNFEKYE